MIDDAALDASSVWIWYRQELLDPCQYPPAAN